MISEITFTKPLSRDLQDPRQWFRNAFLSAIFHQDRELGSEIHGQQKFNIRPFCCDLSRLRNDHTVCVRTVYDKLHNASLQIHSMGEHEFVTSRPIELPEFSDRMVFIAKEVRLRDKDRRHRDLLQVEEYLSALRKNIENRCAQYNVESVPIKLEIDLDCANRKRWTRPAKKNFAVDVVYSYPLYIAANKKINELLYLTGIGELTGYGLGVLHVPGK